jgi:hypothetical protein
MQINIKIRLIKIKAGPEKKNSGPALVFFD